MRAENTQHRGMNYCAAALLLFVGAILLYVRAAPDKPLTRELTSCVFHDEEAQKERKSDDQEHNPSQISCELRDASLSNAATCWEGSDMNAYSSKLGFVERASRRVSDTRTARQVANEVETIGTDD